MRDRCLVCGDFPKARGPRCTGCYHWHRRHGNTAPLLLQEALATTTNPVEIVRILSVLDPSPALLRAWGRATHLEPKR